MPEQTSARPGRINGEDIVTEVLRNMEEGLFKIRYTALVPSIYRVYLHPDEFEPLRGAIPYLIEEVKRSLDEKLDGWNGTRKKPSLMDRLAGVSPDSTEYKRIADEWTVEFFPDANGELSPGEIEIYSELGAAPKPEFGSGSLTRRIVKRSAGAHETVAVVNQEIKPPSVTSTMPLPVTPSQAAGPPAANLQTTTNTGGKAFADIRYQDDAGPHTFAVTKEVTIVGRGGRAYWVDLKLESAPDVSREHCRIRRDGITGKFFIKDVSQFGTTVNGTDVPPSIDRSASEEKDLHIEVPLPDRARIGLAGIVFLDFEKK